MLRPLCVSLVAACLLLLMALPGSVSPGLADQHIYQRPWSPEHGMNVFVFGHPTTTRRDLVKVTAIGFPWVKILFRWTDIEQAYKGASVQS